MLLLLLFTDAGKSFGEIALISDDSVRNATVIADEETDMLVIHRDLFNRSMKVNDLEKYIYIVPNHAWLKYISCLKRVKFVKLLHIK